MNSNYPEHPAYKKFLDLERLEKALQDHDEELFFQALHEDLGDEIDLAVLTSQMRSTLPPSRLQH